MGSRVLLAPANPFLQSILAVALSVLVYHRGQALWMLYNNSPARLSHINTFSSYDIKFADRVRSCEDALIVESRGVAIVACDAGRERWNTVMGVFLEPLVSASLYIYDYKDASAPDAEALKQVELLNFPGKNDFHTLGLAFDEETSTLFAVSHAKAGSRIERFTLDLDRLTATHTGTIQHALINAPNSIAIINSNELYVTNDHYFVARKFKLLSKIETWFGLPLGSVVHVKLRQEKTGLAAASVRVVARAAFANGISILNKTTVAVAACSRGSVNLYHVQRDASLTFKTSFPVSFAPDNLSLHGGKLYIAGHPHLPSLIKFTLTRHICNEPAKLEKASSRLKRYCQSEKTAPSWVAEWSEEEGLKSLYVGTEYPSSATAAKDPSRGVGIVSGLYAKGIMVWRD
ncbi:uncharacterized protein CPUR_02003 [Claviceps purpurea 20.1]|uniref:Uncharacterized protein n=1 Tax=Claviceps purpurea (strain 20.1) TaxID=1111077 RepID=M1WIS8_CLAP2|nr:uncharacterized protein CPUR_02003 [Claviceps purpurea 20.1]